MAGSHKIVWVWSPYPPFVSMERVANKDFEERKIEFEEHPPEPYIRTAHWEGFPSVRAWSTLGINSRYRILRKLDGSETHVEVLDKLRKSFSEGKDTTNVINPLFATTGAALLAIPGIETTHWITRAFFISAILFAIGGVIIGAMVPGIFCLFFGEDIDVMSESVKKEDEMLTWKNHRKLLHEIWEIFSYRTSSITYSAITLVGGIFAFSITADLSSQAMPANSHPPWPAFVMISLGPFALYMAMFWKLWWRLSVWHRETRNAMKNEPAAPSGLTQIEQV